MRTLIVALAAAFGVYVLVIAALAAAGRRTAAKEVAAFLPNFARLFKGLIGDSRVPRSSKALLVLGAAWIASPIDLIPEFIPVLGPLDDAVVAALILRRVLKTAGADVVTDHGRETRRRCSGSFGSALSDPRTPTRSNRAGGPHAL